MQRFDAPFSVDFVHRVRFVRNALDPAQPALLDVLAGGDSEPTKVAAFVDSGVLAAMPEVAGRLSSYLQSCPRRVRQRGEVQVVPGGETCKNEPAALQNILKFIHDQGICRQSCVVVIGGGAVLDVVGLAAALAHRGVRLVRLPTTTLAQADSGVGVKNSVNAFGKKNYLGTFAPPWAVLNDPTFLEALPTTPWREGFAEVVKVGLVKDASLFRGISERAHAVRQRDMDAAWPLIVRSAELHLQHIVTGGDPFEMTAARPLDFGHWAGHKLEQMSDFKLTHGQAVSIGIAIDTVYSSLAGLLAPEAAEQVLATLEALGLPVTDGITADTQRLLEGIEEFREHLGGRLTVTLLRGIGHGIDAHDIDRAMMAQAVATLRARTASSTPPAAAAR